MNDKLLDVGNKENILQEIAGGYSVQSGVFGAVNPKIVTKLNEYGLYTALIDPSALTDDELYELASVSAMSNDDFNEDAMSRRLFSNLPDVSYQDLVGYYLGLYAGYVTKGDFRANASSGGLATWMLSQLLQKGLIDGVIHVTPSTDDEVLFQYSISTTESEILAGAKSRYYPADLSEVLRIAKAAGGRYAVTGIPSFIAELRLLAERDPAYKHAIAYTIGLICGHQKSTKYAEAIAWEQGIQPGELKAIDFRRKVEGSPADEYITELSTHSDGDDVLMAKKASEVFVSSWSHGFFKAKFSDFTDDLFNETADIALGDAWLPEYIGEHQGTNLVIVRNPELASILREGLSSGELHLDQLTPEAVIQSQPGLVRHAFDELPYRLHRSDQRRAWRPQKRQTASNNLASLRRRIQDVREQIAAQSHVHYQEAVELGDWSYFVNKMKPLIDRHNALYTLTDARRLLRKGPRHLIRKAYKEVLRRFSPSTK